ncbi:hypothetical protein HGB13_03560, partial [bacterium]|nr:hypothetical protein [bacterium]
EIIDELTLAKQKIKIVNPSQLALEIAISKLTKKEEVLEKIEIVYEEPKKEIPKKDTKEAKASEKKSNDTKIEKPILEEELVIEEISDANTKNVENSFITVIQSKWLKIVDGLKIHNHSIALCLKTAHPEKIEAGSLHIGFQFPLHKDKIMELDNKRLVEDEIKKQTGKFVPIRCLVGLKHDKVEPQAIDEALNIFEGEVINE